MKRFLLAPIVLACSLFGASRAQAANVTFSGFANSAELVFISVTGPNAAVNEYAYAGGFLASNNGGASFTTYCVDVYDNLWFGQTHDYTPVDGSAHSFANANANVDIGKLYAEGNVVNNAQTQAAFQIAVWEIAYETSGRYDLGNGTAQFTPGALGNSSGAIALAGSWLAELPNVTSAQKLTVFESVAVNGSKFQDQVAAVPEPSTYALMAAGLLSVGFLARRRGGAQR